MAQISLRPGEAFASTAAAGRRSFCASTPTAGKFNSSIPGNGQLAERNPAPVAVRSRVATF
jgi:hypothetical protein